MECGQVRQGIPDEVRAEAWYKLSGAATKQSTAPADYYDRYLATYHEQRARGRRKTLVDIEKVSGNIQQLSLDDNDRCSA